uniref:Uncharacterized protein n=1 Tax=Panagrolaimus sp. JU765 TaxID=591449 RepID=A0AC34RI28_9BILA
MKTTCFDVLVKPEGVQATGDGSDLNAQCTWDAGTDGKLEISVIVPPGYTLQLVGAEIWADAPPPVKTTETWVWAVADGQTPAKHENGAEASKEPMKNEEKAAEKKEMDAPPPKNDVAQTKEKEIKREKSEEKVVKKEEGNSVKVEIIGQESKPEKEKMPKAADHEKEKEIKQEKSEEKVVKKEEGNSVKVEIIGQESTPKKEKMPKAAEHVENISAEPVFKQESKVETAPELPNFERKLELGKFKAGDDGISGTGGAGSRVSRPSTSGKTRTTSSGAPRRDSRKKKKHKKLNIQPVNLENLWDESDPRHSDIMKPGKEEKARQIQRKMIQEQRMRSERAQKLKTEKEKENLRTKETQEAEDDGAEDDGRPQRTADTQKSSDDEKNTKMKPEFVQATGVGSVLNGYCAWNAGTDGKLEISVVLPPGHTLQLVGAAIWTDPLPPVKTTETWIWAVVGVGIVVGLAAIIGGIVAFIKCRNKKAQQQQEVLTEVKVDPSSARSKDPKKEKKKKEEAPNPEGSKEISSQNSSYKKPDELPRGFKRIMNNVQKFIKLEPEVNKTVTVTMEDNNNAKDGQTPAKNEKGAEAPKEPVKNEEKVAEKKATEGDQNKEKKEEKPEEKVDKKEEKVAKDAKRGSKTSTGNQLSRSSKSRVTWSAASSAVTPKKSSKKKTKKKNKKRSKPVNRGKVRGNNDPSSADAKKSGSAAGRLEQSEERIVSQTTQKEEENDQNVWTMETQETEDDAAKQVKTANTQQPSDEDGSAKQ